VIRRSRIAARCRSEDGGGTFRVLNLPFRMSGAKVAGRRMATLGEHTRALLKEAGLSIRRWPRLDKPVIAEQS